MTDTDDTVRLVCTGRYRSDLGDFEAGEEIFATQDTAAMLLRDSPGSFKVWEHDAPAAPEVEAAVADRVAAISEKTTSDLTVPDRRVRGGARRTATKKRAKRT